MKKRKMVLYNVFNNHAKILESGREVAKFLGKNSTANIATVAEGTRSDNHLVINNKYTIFYLDQFDLNNVRARLLKVKKCNRSNLEIIAKDIFSGSTKKYKSIREASKELKADRRSISRVLKGDLEETKGYVFKYADHPDIYIPEAMGEITLD